MVYKKDAIGREYRKEAADSLKELRGLFEDDFENWKKAYSTFVKPIISVFKTSPRTIAYHTNTLIERFNLTPQYISNIGALHEDMVRESGLLQAAREGREETENYQTLANADYAAHSIHNGSRKNRPMSEQHENDQEGLAQDHQSGYNRHTKTPREVDKDPNSETTSSELRRRAEDHSHTGVKH